MPDSIRHNPRFIGILLILASVILISCSDTVAKVISANIPIQQIALLQACTMMLSVPLLVRDRFRFSHLSTRFPWLHLVRSLCQLGGGLCFYTGLKHLPLADLVAILFVGPLLVTVLASLFLGEQVGLRRWVACLVGFVGALIVVRPGFGTLGWAWIYPIASTSFYSVYVICTRRVAPSERGGTLMFYSALASVVVLGLTSPLFWVAPVGAQWLGLVTVSVVSATSAALAIRAYALAPASLLAPFSYVEIVTATFFGFVVFGALPDAFTILGAAVIAGSGLYVLYHEASTK